MKRQEGLQTYSSPVTVEELWTGFSSMIASSLKKKEVKPLKISHMGIKGGVCYSIPKVNQSRGAV